MQKEIDVKEIETVIANYDNEKEPIIIKRKNAVDLMLLSVEEYKKRMFYAELEKEIDESEEEIEQGKTYTVEEVFEELEQKYGN